MRARFEEKFDPKRYREQNSVLRCNKGTFFIPDIARYEYITYRAIARGVPCDGGAYAIATPQSRAQSSETQFSSNSH
jgi:hypothetical protein